MPFEDLRFGCLIMVFDHFVFDFVFDHIRFVIGAFQPQFYAKVSPTGLFLLKLLRYLFVTFSDHIAKTSAILNFVVFDLKMH